MRHFFKVQFINDVYAFIISHDLILEVNAVKASLLQPVSRVKSTTKVDDDLVSTDTGKPIGDDRHTGGMYEDLTFASADAIPGHLLTLQGGDVT
jgi:hypothetical protein